MIAQATAERVNFKTFILQKRNHFVQAPNVMVVGQFESKGCDSVLFSSSVTPLIPDPASDPGYGSWRV